MVAALERVRSSRWLRALEPDDMTDFQMTRVELIAGLKNDEPSIGPSILELLRELADELDGVIEAAPGYASQLPEQMRVLARAAAQLRVAAAAPGPLGDLRGAPARA
jgi:hypothetical protein